MPADSKKVLVVVVAFNEGTKIQATIHRIVGAVNYDVVLVDDGSTDGSIDELRSLPIHVITLASNMGIGFGLKTACQYGLENGYDIVVILAGNNKDEPKEIPLLLKAIEDGSDFVQGSRFLAGGSHSSMPIYRQFATRLHPFLFSLATGKRLTESTNGFRAFKTDILRDQRIDWHQSWLDQYEFEPYLLYKVITLGYKHSEVPVTKIYPPKKLGYTKMKPFTGWWSILRPIFILALGIKK